MTSSARKGATLLAHHLYDFAECEHRIALDAKLDRKLRTPHDAAMQLLLEHGQWLERQIVEPLGYPAVEVEDGDWDGAATRTRALMREGVAGIDQGVLLGDGQLARPDLLEKVAGESALGDFLYVPGDVKSARTTRSDAVFQVAFAAVLLEGVQGVRPESGFLILGDGRKEMLDLSAIRCTVDDAIARAEAIVEGEAASSPFFSAACARCRWRDACMRELQEARDLSFVFGMTRARRRALVRAGVGTIDELAAAEVRTLVDAGAPSDGLERMRAQAEVLLDGRVVRKAAVGLPRGTRREVYLRIETDPLDRGEPFLLSWAEAAPAGPIGTARVAIVSSPAERRAVTVEMLDVLESPALRGEPIYIYGAATAAAFDSLAEEAAVEPGRAGDLAGRFVDLAPWVRRSMVLPVFGYRFDEVAAVARELPRPSPGEAGDALFVLHAGLSAAEDAEAVRRALEEAGWDGLESLCAVRGLFR